MQKTQTLLELLQTASLALPQVQSYRLVNPPT